jgi:hypothetical protein
VRKGYDRNCNSLTACTMVLRCQITLFRHPLAQERLQADEAKRAKLAAERAEREEVIHAHTPRLPVVSSPINLTEDLLALQHLFVNTRGACAQWS